MKNEVHVEILLLNRQPALERDSLTVQHAFWYVCIQERLKSLSISLFLQAAFFRKSREQQRAARGSEGGCGAAQFEDCCS